MKPQRQIWLEIVADMFKRIQDEAFSGLRHVPTILDLDKKKYIGTAFYHNQ
jgi:hypothetical protein